MAANKFFLVSLILVCLSHATHAIINGTFATARLLHNRPVVFIEMKYGNSFADCACGNLVHRSFVITNVTPFGDPKYKDYNFYVRIGSLRMFEGGIVKRTDAYWAMKPLKESEKQFYIYLVRLSTPYKAHGDVDFAFVPPPWHRPRGMIHDERQYMPYIINGFRHPNGEMVGHTLSYFTVRDSFWGDFCKEFYKVDKYQFAEGPHQMINCYVDWECKGWSQCETHKNSEQNDDAGGLYYKFSNIMVAIAHTRVARKLKCRGVPLVGMVENIYYQFKQNIRSYQTDDFDDYPEYPPGSGLFL